MSVAIDTGFTDVKDGESPFYTHESSNPPFISLIRPLVNASGSFLDADTVDGIEAVTHSVGGPNKLVATDQEGYFPFGSIPQNGTTSGGGTVMGVPHSFITLICSTNFGQYAFLTVDTTGSLIVTSTTVYNSEFTLLSNGSTTYWLTFDTDQVMRLQAVSSSTTTRSLTLVDTNLIVWGISVDPDGTIRTTNLGSL